MRLHRPPARGAARLGWALCVAAVASLPAVPCSEPRAGGIRTRLLVPNLDDDNEDGRLDWDASDPQDPDLVELDLPLRRADVVVARGDLGSNRVWQGDRVVVDAYAGERWRVEAPGPLRVELGAFDARLELTVLRGPRVVTSVLLAAAPVTLPHPFRPISRAWVVPLLKPGGAGNIALLDALDDVLGDAMRWIPGEQYGDDRWPQDQFEVAWAVGETGRLRVVLDSPRDGFRGARGGFVERVLGSGPDTYVYALDADDWGSRDSFGNLEVTPPLPGFPEGRIYYGVDGPRGAAPEVVRFLAAQGRQRPFAIDTSRFCVGHVDELVAFVPDPDRPAGFRVLVPSPRVAYTLLGIADGRTRIDAYADLPTPDRAYRTLRELRDDAELRAYNMALEAGPLADLRAVLRAELGLTPQDIVGLPAMYALYDDEDDPDCGAVSLVPNLLNGLTAPTKRGATLLLPDPRLRPAGAGSQEDVFARARRLLLPRGVTARFVDTWETYHVNLGGLHCATNTERLP